MEFESCSARVPFTGSGFPTTRDDMVEFVYELARQRVLEFGCWYRLRHNETEIGRDVARVSIMENE